MVNPAPRTLAGRYEVGELIGRGGMAEVHIGRDNRLGRTVAIKILRSDLARDPSFQARFRREAQAAASLNHPSIVAVYDTGEDTSTESGGGVAHVPFIVMEYVEGHTVRDILRDGAAVPIDEAIEITSGVLSALEYSHHAGIVHRDIKPANVMLTPAGAVKVMDFGIARALADSSQMTQTQAVIGTAQYLSPEQARGETVDTRSDLYSTGCLLYELLTGRPPFIGDSPVAVAYQHVREEPIPPSQVAQDIPRVLDAVVLNSLAKARDDRYSTAAEFRSALEAAGRGEQVAATQAFAAVAPYDTQATQVLSPTSAGATQVFGTPAGGSAPWQGQQNPPQDLLAGGDDDEDENNSKRKVIWTLVAVGVVALLAILGFTLLGGGEEEPDTGRVPTMSGMTIEEVRAALTEAGFTKDPIPSRAASTDVPEGEFIESDPPVGEDVPLNTEITVVMSAGPDATSVPDVTEMTQDEAIAALEEAGLRVSGGASSENSARIPKDSVTRTDPEAGAAVNEGDSIKLFVSNGFVEVPDVRKSSLSEARSVLEGIDMTVVVEEREVEEGEDGTVLEQSPGPGQVEQKSSITLTVAKVVEAEKVAVSNVVGWQRGDAEEEIRRLGLIPVVEEINDNGIPAGQVIRTDPQGGQQVDLATRIKIVVSLGPEQTEDPGWGDNGQGNDGDQGNGDQGDEGDD
ncbi:Stk1 family PASTA domain-containing Ser/Thr kinase [Jonesia quinghaiensis]|uniref:Stk1 family PASTA domain-containing Ser/Thr kinase n=1 Tax=Jonesia quinghaiensis TaxID=262806 RepID=UPI00041E5F32|nr:Stk1 family PASTA domain-containing Ser/Thr kinase [Jonesia quinghaiensis]